MDRRNWLTWTGDIEFMAKTYMTVERQMGETYWRNTFAVYEIGTYPRSSVLAGRQSRKFIDGGFETVEAALAKYPKARVIGGTTYIPVEQMVSHLPDDTDY
jgi:hypothetical protein